MRRAKSAMSVGKAAASRYRNMLNSYQSMTGEQESLLAFVVADAIRQERTRMRRHYRKPKP